MRCGKLHVILGLSGCSGLRSYFLCRLCLITARARLLLAPVVLPHRLDGHYPPCGPPRAPALRTITHVPPFHARTRLQPQSRPTLPLSCHRGRVLMILLYTCFVIPCTVSRYRRTWPSAHHHMLVLHRLAGHRTPTAPPAAPANTHAPFPPNTRGSTAFTGTFR